MRGPNWHMNLITFLALYVGSVANCLSVTLRKRRPGRHTQECGRHHGRGWGPRSAQQGQYDVCQDFRVSGINIPWGNEISFKKDLEGSRGKAVAKQQPFERRCDSQNRNAAVLWKA